MVYLRMIPLGLWGGSQDTTTLLADEGTVFIPAGGPGSNSPKKRKVKKNNVCRCFKETKPGVTKASQNLMNHILIILQKTSNKKNCIVKISYTFQNSMYLLKNRKSYLIYFIIWQMS